MSTIAQLYQIGEGGQVAPAKIINWLLAPTFAQGAFDGVTIGAVNPGPATFTGVVVTTGGLTVLGGGVAVTGAFSATTLAIGATQSFTDTGTIGTFASNTNSYNQVIIQNLNSGAVASSSYVAVNNAGTATTNYVEMGINSSGFTGTGAFNQPGYSYLASASTDLAIGTYGANSIHFVVNSGATDAMTINGTTGAVSVAGAFSAGSFSTASINNTPIGNTTPSTGAFTTLSASSGLNSTAVGNTAPSTGAFTTLSATGQLTSTLASGRAPFVVASTTQVANLNASYLGGATFASPGPIGGTVPSSGAFTSLTLSSALTVGNGGTGVNTLSGLAYGNATSAFTAATAAQVVAVIGATAVANATNATTLGGATFAAPGAIGGTTPGSGAFTTLSATGNITGLVADPIQSITATVAANALTVGYAGGPLYFRNATLTTGSPVALTVGSLSLTVPSTATLGTVATIQAQLALVVLYNGGTPALGIVNMAGGVNLDETTLLSTTAISAAATANNVVYSNSTITNSPFRVVGYINITEATAGTWATAPTLVQGAGGQAMAAMQSLGYGQTWQNVVGSRTLGTTYYNTTSKPISVNLYVSASSGTPALTLSVNGGTAITVAIASSSVIGATTTVAIPAGASYVFAMVSGTINSWNELR